MSDKIVVGNIVEGKVLKIKPFGAIVLLEDNIQGLVHISQISNSYVQNIDDHLSAGDVVKVKILSVDIPNKKISLSIKDAAEPSASASRPTNRHHHENNQGHQNNHENSYKPKQNQEPQSYGLEEKLKDWLKVSNERQAGLNKRNKRR